MKAAKLIILIVTITLIFANVNAKVGYAADTKSNVPKIEVCKADKNVSDKIVKFTYDVLNKVTIQLLKDTTGELLNNVQIILVSKDETYRSALINIGAPLEDIEIAATQASAMTVNSNIVIALYKIEDYTELAETITHEMTHVVLIQNGINVKMPIWVNEGLAWYNGMLVMTNLDLKKAKEVTGSLNYDLNQVIKDGQLIPLHKLDIEYYSAPYNVEWESYLATLGFIMKKNDGWKTLKSFIDDVKSSDFEKSFKTHYGVTVREYEDEFYKLKVGYYPLDSTNK